MTDYSSNRLIMEAYERMNESEPKADDRFHVVDELDVCKDVAKRIASNFVEMFESGKFKSYEGEMENIGCYTQWFDFENETYKSSVAFRSEDHKMPKDIDGIRLMFGALDAERIAESDRFRFDFDVGTNRAGNNAPIIVKTMKGYGAMGGYGKMCTSKGERFYVSFDVRVLVKEDTDLDMLGEPFGKCLSVPDESRFGDIKSDFDDAEDDSVVDKYDREYVSEDGEADELAEDADDAIHSLDRYVPQGFRDDPVVYSAIRKILDDGNVPDITTSRAHDGKKMIIIRSKSPERGDDIIGYNGYNEPIRRGNRAERD